MQEILIKYCKGEREWTKYPDRSYPKQIRMAIIGKIKHYLDKLEKIQDNNTFEKYEIEENCDSSENDNDYKDEDYDESEIENIEGEVKNYDNYENDNPIKLIKKNKYQESLEKTYNIINEDELFGYNQEEIYSLVYSLFPEDKLAADVFIEFALNNNQNKRISENIGEDIKNIENAKKRMKRAIKGSIRNDPWIQKLKAKNNY